MNLNTTNNNQKISAKCFRCESWGVRNGISSRKQRFICSNESCDRKNFYCSYLPENGKYKYYYNNSFRLYTYEEARAKFIEDTTFENEIISSDTLLDALKKFDPINYNKKIGKKVTYKEERLGKLKLILKELIPKYKKSILKTKEYQNKYNKTKEAIEKLENELSSKKMIHDKKE